MAAMSVVRYVVTPSIRLDGTNARPTQRSPPAEARAIRAGGIARLVGGLPDAPGARQTTAAHARIRTTKTP